MKNIIIVGGGVAGMIAAITAAKSGKSVTILEKNSELGKKILITGNGRCNFTNEYMSSKCYESSISANEVVIANDNRLNVMDGNDRGNVLRDNTTRLFTDTVLNHYTNRDFLASLDDMGMSYYTREGYYYPRTDEARTFRDTLVSEIRRLGVEVVYDFNLRSIEKVQEGYILSDKTTKYSARSIVIASGGNAAPKTGSGGDCYYYLKKLGHNIMKPYPVLTNLKADYSDMLQGVNALATISLIIDDKKVASEKGFIKFYKGMLSGIPIYQLSMIAVPAIDAGKKVEISVDFVTDTGIVRSLDIKGTSIKEALCKSVNPKIVDVILKDNNIDSDILTDNIHTTDREHIIELFSNVNYEIIGVAGFDNAQATLGGVDIREINPDTMESNICKGLYFAGEIIDITGRCGGYNIQWAYSTAVIAGMNA